MAKLLSYYQRQQRKGRIYSLILHAFLLLMVIIGLPSFLQPTIPVEPVAITVELLPITGITNVMPSPTPPTPEEKPEEKKAPPEEKKPAPPKAAEKVPEKKPELTVPDKDVKPKKEEKKEVKKEEKKEEKKPKKDDLADILKGVKDLAKKKNADEKKDDTKKPDTTPNTSKSISTQYNPSQPMSMSEKDAIMSQISECWITPTGGKEAYKLTVQVTAEYNMDGSLIQVGLAPQNAGRYATDSFYRAAADAAIRAVKKCTPLKNLPPDKYQTWKVIDLNFDPQFMAQ